ncbi:MAG: hypothetical protein HYZ07_02785 [Candidatus Harrisonbacteria bacterium]|nr:hypothetical protein [Candidatus Harrisonbacteria bacterium]
MKKADAAHALAPYERILAKARKKLDMRTPFSLRAGDRWYFDVPHDRSAFTLTCPPFSRDTEPSFLHYLCHAHIVDAGWLLPVTETKNINKAAFFYTVNRSIDHFFDYYAWRLVTEKFGKRYPLRVSREVAGATPARIIQGLRIIQNDFQSPYPAFVTALDWFALFPIVASFVDHRREANILARFAQLRRRNDFIAATIPSAAEKIEAAQTFFRTLLRAYPHHDTLLANTAIFKRMYRKYYRLIWNGTGLKTRISAFY